MRARREHGWMAAALGVILLLSGCAAEGDPAPTSAALGSPSAAAWPDGLAIELIQARSDVASRQASVRIHNGTSGELVVTDVHVDDPRFVGAVRRTAHGASRVAPGQQVDIRVQLPAVDCAVADAGSEAHAVLTLGEVTPIVVAAAIGDTVPFVSALHERECVAERVVQAWEVSVAGIAASDPGEPGALILHIEATGKDPMVHLRGVRQTNLIRFLDAAGDGVAALDAATLAADGFLRLAIEPDRCDPHVVQEDKRGTVFRVLVDVDGRDESFDVAASPEVRAETLTWVARWCGFGQ